jgi:hypothetical protein
MPVGWSEIINGIEGATIWEGDTRYEGDAAGSTEGSSKEIELAPWSRVFKKWEHEVEVGTKWETFRL